VSRKLAIIFVAVGVALIAFGMGVPFAFHANLPPNLGGSQAGSEAWMLLTGGSATILGVIGLLSETGRS
jgi:hypothetical protein